MVEEQKMIRAEFDFDPHDLGRPKYFEFFDKAERVLVLSPIAMMPQKTAILVIVRWKGEPDHTWSRSHDLIDEIFDMGTTAEGHIHMFLGTEDPWAYGIIELMMQELRVFFDWPLILRKDRVTAAFIGTRPCINNLVEMLGGLGIRLSLRSINDYNPLASSPLDKMTDVQRDYVVHAYKGGYFEDRRKKSLTKLAAEKKVSAPTYMTTLRRGLRRLLDQAMVEE